ncbi:MAG: RimK family alpha-L-glutamate ligase [Candidatus Neomarinimicrobiota bacterium]
MLTIKDLSYFECYDDLLVPPMNALGWDVSFIPWDHNDVDWDEYDIVLVRSTWDYQSRILEFLKVLQDIDRSNAILINSLAAIIWNIEKTYLLELDKKGIDIIPSIFQIEFSMDEIMKSFSRFRFNSEKIIMKPVVGANADNILLKSKIEIKSQFNRVESIYSGLPHIIQPFLDSVLKDG